MTEPNPLKAAIVQAEPGSGVLPGVLDALRVESPDLVVLPEYFWARPDDSGPLSMAARFEEIRAGILDLSRAVDAVWVGGTAVEPRDGRLYNTCIVAAGGAEVGRYRKRRLMPGEAQAGLTPGADPFVVTARGITLGVMICADVLVPESYDLLAPHAPDAIAVPTNSPFRPHDTVEEKMARDESYFVAGARRTGAAVLKACTTGLVFGRPVQGRSLAASPAGVLERVPFDLEGEARILTVEIARRSRVD